MLDEVQFVVLKFHSNRVTPAFSIVAADITCVGSGKVAINLLFVLLLQQLHLNVPVLKVN
jgi:hypothetical protein